MRDARVARHADLLVDYSLGLQSGELVRIDGGTVATPLIQELYRASLRVGAHPLVRTAVDGLDGIFFEEASDDQIEFVPAVARQEVEEVDAVVTIWGDRNTRRLSRVEPGRLSRRLSVQRSLTKRLWERIDAGEARWVGTRFPTDGHAQDAEMSLADYEDFVYAACHVREQDDPVAHWASTSGELMPGRASSKAARSSGCSARTPISGSTWRNVAGSPPTAS